MVIVVWGWDWDTSFGVAPERTVKNWKLKTVFAAALWLLASVAWAETAPDPPELAVEDLPVEALATHLIKQIQEETYENLWEPVSRLVRLGKLHGRQVTEKLAAELHSTDAKLRSAAARALCRLNAAEIAAPVLLKLVLKGKAPAARRQAAKSIGLTIPLYGKKAPVETLIKALEKETEPLTRIFLARTLWRVGSRQEGKQALVRLMLSASEKAVRDEATLVLAELGFLTPKKEWIGRRDEKIFKEVFSRVVNLGLQPTAQGERAFNLHRWKVEENAHAVRDPGLAKGERLLREVLAYIRNLYVDPDKVNLEKLFERASKGLLESLDPFSQYLNREEVQTTQEMLRQDYGGIGAYVTVRDHVFTVVSPIYNSPAYKAGLRSMDSILEVDGRKTSKLLDQGGMTKVISKLKGKPGTKVRVKFFRRGFLKPLEVTIVRDRIRIQSVYHAMLPGRIGYIRLTRFGERSVKEMDKSLKELLKKGKARGIVLDLRDNPGGLLQSGVDIADRFLAADKLIVSSKGRRRQKDFHSKGGEEDEAFSLVVLVNSGSASASEIVAGCLQDHKRATLVGEKTFGKGSVQQIIPLRATKYETQLRLTIAKYYLPSNRSIHEKGITADVEFKPVGPDDWTLRQVFKMRQKHLFEDYARAHWDDHKALFLKLAQDDEGKPGRYPDFEKFYKSVEDYRVKKDDVRAELRRMLRRMTQDELKKEFTYDLQTDEVLQRGILEMLSQLEIDPASIAQYKDYPQKFKKKSADIAEQGAMLPTEKEPAH